MLCRCPDCQTLFRVTDAQLQQAEGWLRCGQCQAVFQPSAEELIDEHGPQPPDLVAEALAQERDYAEDRDTHPPGLTLPEDDDTESTPVMTAERDEEIPDILVDDLAAAGQPRRRGASLLWSFGALLMVLVLAGQFIYIFRDELARNDHVRPWLAKACATLGCQLQLPHNTELYRLLNRDIIVPPDQPDTLLISASIANIASHTQAYPVVEVVLSDNAGRAIAMRRIAPEEYLHKDEDPQQGMPPNVPLAFSLRVRKPVQDVNTFQFSFR